MGKSLWVVLCAGAQKWVEEKTGGRQWTWPSRQLDIVQLQLLAALVLIQQHVYSTDVKGGARTFIFALCSLYNQELLAVCHDSQYRVGQVSSRTTSRGLRPP